MLAFLLANAAILGLALIATWLGTSDRTPGYTLVQEDEALEWLTFWAFLLAALGWAVIRRRASGAAVARARVWAALLAVFCALVAFEEISWGQRILAYQPPAYFLEHNRQQELNVHNTVETELRVALFRTLLAGYGLLGLAAALPGAPRRWLHRTGLAFAAPAPGLLPAFAAMLALYEWYPWSYTAEFVEAMFGLGLLCAALRAGETAGAARRPFQGLASTSLALAACAALGAGSAAATRWQRADDPRIAELARQETLALREDVRALRSAIEALGCGLHRRVYGWVDREGLAPLRSGRFAGLVSEGMPESRARFFLDPWNSPYWIKHECDEPTGRQAVFFYSFGPDRIRDTTGLEVLGDDVGAYVLTPGHGERPWR